MTEFDATTPKKDSFRPKRNSPRSAGQLEAKEFISAILAYPRKLQFSLWNLQGDIGIRHSCTRRGKVPSELDFTNEIALAKMLGWLKELDEDAELTKKEHGDQTGIRYGRRFERVAKASVIRQQTKQFIDLFVKKGGCDT